MSSPAFTEGEGGVSAEMVAISETRKHGGTPGPGVRGIWDGCRAAGFGLEWRNMIINSCNKYLLE